MNTGKKNIGIGSLIAADPEAAIDVTDREAPTVTVRGLGDEAVRQVLETGEVTETGQTPGGSHGVTEAGESVLVEHKADGAQVTVLLPKPPKSP